MSSTTPWANGIYKFKSCSLWVFEVKGEVLHMIKTAFLEHNYKNPAVEGMAHTF